jgi:hypothetical protein
MWVGVLGPLEVRADGLHVDVAGPIPRRLLAILATRPGRFVPVGVLTTAYGAMMPRRRPGPRCSRMWPGCGVRLVDRA